MIRASAVALPNAQDYLHTMPVESEPDLAAAGLYSGSEAARLVRIPSRKIRAWLTTRRQLWPARLPPDDRRRFFLDFKDLMEVRVVAALRARNFSLQKIRTAIGRVRDLYPNETHPLVSGRLHAEGRQFLHVTPLKASAPGHPVEEVTSGQYSWGDLLKLEDVRDLMLSAWEVLHDVEFDANGPGMRWYPLRDAAPSVVLDPEREYGQPIIYRVGLPTAVITDMRRNYTDAQLTDGFGVRANEIADALTFETEIAGSA